MRKILYVIKVLQQKEKLPSLQHNIQEGNSLVFGTEQYLKKYFKNNYEEYKPFNYDDIFSDVFSKGGFDVIIGNPPYVQLSMDTNLDINLKNYLLETYKSSMGRLNTFGFFIKHGIDLLKDKGYLSFIIPNTILTQDYYEDLRLMILNSCCIDGIVSFEDLPFKDAVVENVIIILQKNKNESTRNSNKVTIYKLNEDYSFKQDKIIPQKLFLKTHKYSFNINLDNTKLSLKDKLFKDSSPLKIFLEINQAIALKHERAKYITDKKHNKQCKPVIDGRNINRYSVKWDGTYLIYDIDAIHSCKREDIFLSKEKLFFRRVGDRLISAYDDEQLYALNTLVVMNLKDNIDLNIKYYLALFNSRLLNWYYQNFLKSTKKVFSEIQARQVAQIPIKNVNENNKHYQNLISYASKIIELNKKLSTASKDSDKYNNILSEIDKCDTNIDKEVYKLYNLETDEIEAIDKFYNNVS